ncbi:MAG: glycosyltransferase family 2 protein [Clostridia bacterium]|nr:glycosyltransferase family 2 protein [Clostridia bacterium]
MEKQYIFSFVILNYITTKDTIECIKSIKNNCKEYKFNIIVVDNASPNNSGYELKHLFEEDTDVKVIINEKNIGFARGNNVGYQYAKEKYKPDFIILCNSDTEILNDNFCIDIIEKYKQTNFALMGPKEKLADGGFYILTEKARSKIALKLSISYYNKIIQNKSLTFSRILLKANSVIERKKLDVEKEYTNICLHGAFLIFSKQYIDLFNGLNEATFLYGEEEFLYWRLKMNNLLSIYYPKIEILHKRNHSTKASIIDDKERKIKQAKWHLDSAKKLLRALNGDINI